VLPRKGKLSAASRAVENEPAFKVARRRHSQVESAIAALENHGLDRVLDHGLDGFRRYVSLAIVGRNALRLGQLLMPRDREEAKQKTA
jgi:IS5 family transposase